MENGEKKQYTAEQIRVHNIIQEWKKRKMEDEKQAREDYHNPEMQAILKELTKKNEARRTSSR